MNGHENPNDIENFEKELSAAFSTICEIDIDEGRKAEILRRAKSAEKRAPRRVLFAFAACAAFATALFSYKTSQEHGFDLDDIVIANEADDGNRPTRLEALWKKAANIDTDIGTLEAYALACVSDDFAESARQNASEPLRKIREQKVRTLLVFIKQEH